METIMKSLKEKKQTLWRIGKLLLLGLIIYFAYLHFRSLKTQVADLEAINNQLNTELIITRNSFGQEIAKREVLELSNTDMLLSINVKDETIKTLQLLVQQITDENKKLKSALVVLSQTTLIHTDSIINTVVDTVLIGDKTFPTYRKEIDMFGKWVRGSATMGVSFFNMDLVIHNDYGVSIYSEKQGLFKPRKVFAEIINYNPYTSTTDMRTFMVKDKPKTKISFFVGVGVGIGAVVLVNKIF